MAGLQLDQRWRPLPDDFEPDVDEADAYDDTGRTADSSAGAALSSAGAVLTDREPEPPTRGRWRALPDDFEPDFDPPMGFVEKASRAGEAVGRKDRGAILSALDKIDPVQQKLDRYSMAEAAHLGNDETGRENIRNLTAPGLYARLKAVGATSSDIAKLIDPNRMFEPKIGLADVVQFGKLMAGDPVARAAAEDELFKRTNTMLRTSKEYAQEQENRGRTWGGFAADAAAGAETNIGYMLEMGLLKKGQTVPEAMIRFAELTADDVVLDEAGNLVVSEKGAGYMEAGAKASLGAIVGYAIERGATQYLGKKAAGAGKWLDEATGGHVAATGKYIGDTLRKYKEKLAEAGGKRVKDWLYPSQIRTAVQSLGKQVEKARDRFPTLNRKIQEFNKAVGFHSLGEEIFVEELADQWTDAIGNLSNQYETRGFRNLPDATVQFATELPEMAAAMFLVRGGQYGASVAMTEAQKAQRNRKIAENLTGLSEGIDGFVQSSPELALDMTLLRSGALSGDVATYLAANQNQHRAIKKGLRGFGLSNSEINDMKPEDRADKLWELFTENLDQETARGWFVGVLGDASQWGKKGGEKDAPVDMTTGKPMAPPEGLRIKPKFYPYGETTPQAEPAPQPAETAPPAEAAPTEPPQAQAPNAPDPPAADTTDPTQPGPVEEPAPSLEPEPATPPPAAQQTPADSTRAPANLSADRFEPEQQEFLRKRAETNEPNTVYHDLDNPGAWYTIHKKKSGKYDIRWVRNQAGIEANKPIPYVDGMDVNVIAWENATGDNAPVGDDTDIEEITGVLGPKKDVVVTRRRATKAELAKQSRPADAAATPLKALDDMEPEEMREELKAAGVAIDPKQKNRRNYLRSELKKIRPGAAPEIQTSEVQPQGGETVVEKEGQTAGQAAKDVLEADPGQRAPVPAVGETLPPAPAQAQPQAVEQKVPREEKAPASNEKPVWEMSRDEFAQAVKVRPSGKDLNVFLPNGEKWLHPGNHKKQEAIHSIRRAMVRRAIDAGKKIPPDVMADFPELNQESQETEKPARRLLSPGAVVTTSSGRKTSPVPKFTEKTPGKTLMGKLDQWLLDEARIEAEGNDFLTTRIKGMNPKRLSEGDRDDLNEILFGEPVKKDKPFLRDLAPKAPAEENTPERQAKILTELMNRPTVWQKRRDVYAEENWQSYLQRFRDRPDILDTTTRDKEIEHYRELHFNAVARAIDKGEPVPDEVLSDYPALVRAKKKRAEKEKAQAPAAKATPPQQDELSDAPKLTPEERRDQIVAQIRKYPEILDPANDSPFRRELKGEIAHAVLQGLDVPEDIAKAFEYDAVVADNAAKKAKAAKPEPKTPPVARDSESAPKATADPATMTLEEFYSAKGEELRAEYPDADDETIAETLENYTQDWVNAVHKKGETERLPDAVLDSYVNNRGKQAYNSQFRGTSEQKGYVFADVRNKKPEIVFPKPGKEPWEQTWAERRDALRPGKTERKFSPQEWRAENTKHEDAVRDALDRGDKVPSKVLADYPHLAPWKGTPIERFEGKSFTAYSKESRNNVVLTPSASERGRWQITRFDAAGQPTGDTIYDSWAHAVRTEMRFGLDASTAKDPNDAAPATPKTETAAEKAPTVEHITKLRDEIAEYIDANDPPFADGMKVSNVSPVIKAANQAIEAIHLLARERAKGNDPDIVATLEKSRDKAYADFLKLREATVKDYEKDKADRKRDKEKRAELAKLRGEPVEEPDVAPEDIPNPHNHDLALVERIVEAARRPMPQLVSKVKTKGTDGKWYGIGGMPPPGHYLTSETKTIWVVKSPDGTTGGKETASEDELRARLQAGFDKDAALFRAILLKGTAEQLQSQAEAWLKNKAPYRAKPLTEPVTIDDHKNTLARIYAGELTIEQVKHEFQRLLNSEAGIKADLNTRTVKQLAPNGSRYGKKSEIIDAIYERFLSRYHLADSLMYDPFREKYRDAIRRHVMAQTQEDLDKAITAQNQAVAEVKKAMENPETIQEFQTFVSRRGEQALTSEQRARYDSLLAESTRERGIRDKERAAVVQQVEGAANVGMEIVEREHSKRGHTVFIVTMAERVDGPTFKALAESARKLGGNYAREWKPTNSPAGFTFNDRESAEKFMALREQSIDRSADVREHAQTMEQAAAQKLTDLADRMEAEANEGLNRDRKTNTARRAGQAEHADAEARKRIAMAKTLRNLADAIRQGLANHLRKVSARTHVEQLDTLLRTAMRQANEQLKRPYQREGQQPTLEDIDYIKWPWPRINDLQVREVLDTAAAAKVGASLHINRLRKRLDAATRAGNAVLLDDAQAIWDMKQVLEKAGRHLESKAQWATKTVREELLEYTRLEQMGITELPQLRAALREYMQYKSGVPKADRAKSLERSLAGRKLPGFFPTPEAVRQQMMDAAGIEQGMTVLEPSAGAGNIAEDARAAGGDVDVVEIQSTLREILEAKGFPLVGHDFLTFETDKQYDRIVMNPPWGREAGQSDIEHVRKAYDLLAPGGRVVAVMSEGVFSNRLQAAVDFREWLEAQGGTAEQLPEGSFEDSTEVRTTGVATRLVVIDKPMITEPELKAELNKEQDAARDAAETEPEPTPGDEVKAEDKTDDEERVPIAGIPFTPRYTADERQAIMAKWSAYRKQAEVFDATLSELSRELARSKYGTKKRADLEKRINTARKDKSALEEKYNAYQLNEQRHRAYWESLVDSNDEATHLNGLIQMSDTKEGRDLAYTEYRLLLLDELKKLGYTFDTATEGMQWITDAVAIEISYGTKKPKAELVQQLANRYTVDKTRARGYAAVDAAAARLKEAGAPSSSWELNRFRDRIKNGWYDDAKVADFIAEVNAFANREIAAHEAKVAAEQKKTREKVYGLFENLTGIPSKRATWTNTYMDGRLIRGSDTSQWVTDGRFGILRTELTDKALKAIDAVQVKKHSQHPNEVRVATDDSAFVKGVQGYEKNIEWESATFIGYHDGRAWIETPDGTVGGFDEKLYQVLKNEIGDFGLLIGKRPDHDAYVLRFTRNGKTVGIVMGIANTTHTRPADLPKPTSNVPDVTDDKRRKRENTATRWVPENAPSTPTPMPAKSKPAKKATATKKAAPPAGVAVSAAQRKAEQQSLIAKIDELLKIDDLPNELPAAEENWETVTFTASYGTWTIFKTRKALKQLREDIERKFPTTVAPPPRYSPDPYKPKAGKHPYTNLDAERADFMGWYGEGALEERDKLREFFQKHGQNKWTVEMVAKATGLDEDTVNKRIPQLKAFGELSSNGYPTGRTPMERGSRLYKDNGGDIEGVAFSATRAALAQRAYIYTGDGQRRTRLTRADIQRALPWAQIARNGEDWEVTLPNGRRILIRTVREIPLTPARIAQIRQKYPNIMGSLDDARINGMFVPMEIVDHFGNTIDAADLMLLAENIGESEEIVRHEALHWAYSMGLFTKQEWAGLVERYAKGLDEDKQEEAIARALQPSSGIWKRIQMFLRKVFAKMMGDRLTVAGIEAEQEFRSGYLFARTPASDRARMGSDNPQVSRYITTDRMRALYPSYSIGDTPATGTPKPWPGDFPNVLQMTSATKVIKHPDHAAAKAGGKAAAFRLVEDLFKPDKARALGMRHPNAIVVAVHAEEATGRNKIPQTLANFIGQFSGLAVDEGITQTVRAHRTGKDAWYRMANRPAFTGKVEPGRDYIVVDDIVTVGSSLSELRNYIESNGGNVVEMVTMGAAQFGAKIALTTKTQLALESKFGVQSLRDFLQRHNILGGEYRALTEAEARILLRAVSLDAAGDRILAAGQSGNLGMGPRATAQEIPGRGQQAVTDLARNSLAGKNVQFSIPRGWEDQGEGKYPLPPDVLSAHVLAPWNNPGDKPLFPSHPLYGFTPPMVEIAARVRQGDITDPADLAYELSLLDDVPANIQTALDDYLAARDEDRFVYGMRSGLDEEYGDQLIAAVERYYDEANPAGDSLTDSNERFSLGWHGTPHTFDKFSTAHIGRGEGGQAFGWGLYFAGKKAVAEFYRDSVTRRHKDSNQKNKFLYKGKEVDLGEIIYDPEKTPFNPDQQLEIWQALNRWASGWSTQSGNSPKLKKGWIRQALGRHFDYLTDLRDGALRDGDLEFAEDLKARRAWIVDVLQHFEELPPQKGRLYKVELKPEEDEYLLWDKSLPEQSDKVKAALQAMGYDPNAPVEPPQWSDGGNDFLSYQIQTTRTVAGAPPPGHRAMAHVMPSGKQWIFTIEGADGQQKLRAWRNTKEDAKESVERWYAEHPEQLRAWREKAAIPGNWEWQTAQTAPGAPTKYVYGPKDHFPLAEAEFNPTTNKWINRVYLPHSGEMANYSNVHLNAEDAKAEAAAVARKYNQTISTGQQLYRSLARETSDDQASSELRAAGIRGIKYLNAASRSAGEGDYNYVLFDDADVDIVERYSFSIPKVERSHIDAAKDFAREWYGNSKHIPNWLRELRKKKDPSARDDLHMADRLLRTMLYYAPKVPTLQRMLDVAMRRQDDAYAFTDLNLGTGANDDHAPIRELLNKHKNMYQKINGYLWNKDRDAVGMQVRQVDKTTWEVESEPDQQGKRQPLGRFGSEDAAWLFAYKTEAERIDNTLGKTLATRAKPGELGPAGRAVLAARRINHRVFAMLRHNLEQLEQEYKALGREMPAQLIIHNADGSKEELDLWEALKRMGDRRGYYMPRHRKNGRYALFVESRAIGKGKVSNPQRLHFDTPIGRALHYVWLRGQGYKPEQIHTDVITKPSEEAFLEGNLVAMNDMVQNALHSMRRAARRDVTFKDLGMEADTHTYVRKDGTKEKHLIVQAPKDHEFAEAFKEFGGHFYDDGQTNTGPAWHFVKPSKKLKDRILARLAMTQIAQRNLDLFHEALLTNLAEIVHGRGSRSHKIGRSEARGTDVFVGYDEDLERAVVRLARGVAGGSAKRLMAKDLVNTFMGTDISWHQFKKDKLPADFDTLDPEDKRDELEALHAEYEAMVAEKRIDSGSQPEAFREGMDFMRELLRNEEPIERVLGVLKGLTAAKYLSRVSSALINLTALPTVVVPAMHTFAGVPFSRAMVLVPQMATKYTTHWLQQKGVNLGPNAPVLTKAERELFDDIRRRRWDDAQFRKETLSTLQGMLGRNWNKATDTLLIVFTLTEKLNRGATVAAAYMGIKEKAGKDWTEDMHEEAMLQAHKVMNMAHGMYSKENAPSWTRGGTVGAVAARSAYMFSTFTHNYLQLVHATAKERDPRAVAWLLVAPMILAGPEAGVASALGTLAMKAVRAIFEEVGIPVPDDILAGFYEWIEENFGSLAGRFARQGLVGAATGADIRGSLGVQFGLPTNIWELLGAPASSVADFVDAGKALGQGNPMEAVEKAAPAALAAPLRAYREYTEGVTTTKDYRRFYGDEAIRPGAYATFLRSLGFTPADISTKLQKANTDAAIAAKYSDMRDSIYRRVRLYVLEGNNDPDAYAEILEAANAYNERVKARGLRKGLVPMITNDSLKGQKENMIKAPAREASRDSTKERKAPKVTYTPKL